MKRPEELRQRTSKRIQGGSAPSGATGGKAMERVKQFQLARGLDVGVVLAPPAADASKPGAKARPAGKKKARPAAKAMPRR